MIHILWSLKFIATHTPTSLTELYIDKLSIVISQCCGFVYSSHISFCSVNIYIIGSSFLSFGEHPFRLFSILFVGSNFVSLRQHSLSLGKLATFAEWCADIEVAGKSKSVQHKTAAPILRHCSNFHRSSKLVLLEGRWWEIPYHASQSSITHSDWHDIEWVTQVFLRRRNYIWEYCAVILTWFSLCGP